MLAINKKDKVVYLETKCSLGDRKIVAIEYYDGRDGLPRMTTYIPKGIVGEIVNNEHLIFSANGIELYWAKNSIYFINTQQEQEFQQLFMTLTIPGDYDLDTKIVTSMTKRKFIKILPALYAAAKYPNKKSINWDISPDGESIRYYGSSTPLVDNASWVNLMRMQMGMKPIYRKIDWK